MWHETCVPSHYCCAMPLAIAQEYITQSRSQLTSITFHWRDQERACMCCSSSSAQQSLTILMRSPGFQDKSTERNQHAGSITVSPGTQSACFAEQVFTSSTYFNREKDHPRLEFKWIILRLGKNRHCRCFYMALDRFLRSFDIIRQAFKNATASLGSLMLQHP